MAADEKWFTALYTRHFDDIERYLHRRTSEEATRDLTAEVFLVAWRRRGDVPRHAPLPWLYGVAHHVLANEVRGRVRARRLVERAAVQQAGATEYGMSADHAGGVAGRLALAAAFERISSADQEVLRLVAWERLSVVAAARVVGCRATTFAMRLHRARRRLRALLDESPQPDTEGAVPVGRPADVLPRRTT